MTQRFLTMDQARTAIALHGDLGRARAELAQLRQGTMVSMQVGVPASYGISLIYSAAITLPLSGTLKAELIELLKAKVSGIESQITALGVEVPTDPDAPPAAAPGSLEQVA